MNSITQRLTLAIVFTITLILLPLSSAWSQDWREVLGPDTSLTTYESEVARTTQGVLDGKDFYSVTIHGESVDTTTGWWGDEAIHCTSTRTDVTEEFRCN